MKGSRPGALANEAVHFPQQLFMRGLQRRAPRVDNDVPPALDLRQTQTKQFTDAPLRTVSLHGLPECPGRSEPQPRTRPGRPIHRKAERREIRTGKTDPILIDPAELSGTEEPSGLGEPET